MAASFIPNSCAMRCIAAFLFLLWAGPSSAAWFVTVREAHWHQERSSPSILLMSSKVGPNKIKQDGYVDFTPRDEWKAMSQEERNKVIEIRRLAVVADDAISDTNTNSIYTGTVKWFDTKKGFGFIRREKDGEEVFVHQTSVVADGFRALKDGASVEFQMEVGADGKTKAICVTGQGSVPLQRGFAYKKRD